MMGYARNRRQRRRAVERSAVPNGDGERPAAFTVERHPLPQAL
jgi:hypothetical protein